MRFAELLPVSAGQSRHQQGWRLARATLAALAAIGVAPAVDAETINPGAWVNVPAPADPVLQNLNVVADAPTRGMWSAVQSWPLNGLHTAMLPNGKVLTFGSTLDGAGQNGRYFDLWDPTLGYSANSHTTTYDANRQDSFCASATYLTDGRLMISGGNGSVTTTFYNPSNNTTATGTARMADERWYSTMLTLPDGRPLILGGMVPYSEGMQNNPDLSVAQGLASMTPELYENGNWRSLFGANSRDAFGPDYLRGSYPRAWVAPGGQVFGISAEKMWYLDPAGNGTIRTAGTFKGPPSTTAPVNVGATNSAVMYAPGRILQVGGNGAFNGDGLPASRMATVVDFNGTTPVLTEQPPMTYARRYANTIVLADGRVVVTGGTLRGNENGTNAVFAAEIWNPNTGTWTVGASAAIYRGYHSQTTLLPNGTILSTGGGAPGPVTNVNAEIYYPPNLFRTVNNVAQLAPRPVIKAISGLSYANATPIQMDMVESTAISQLVLLGASSGTHSFNSGQRRIPLSFAQEGYRLTATLPSSDLAPPGYYQLIAIDANGVPSRGVIIAIGQGVSAPPVTTTPYNPPDLNVAISAPIITAGGTASYSFTATGNTTYSWSFGDGTAATAFSSNPTVTHVFAQAGVYVVTLTARAADGATSTRTFLQAVAAPATARKPNASSAVAIETRASASARLWVVNPDNDSVSVIDTATNARVAEITVGAAPRSVAIAPDGRVWVTNKGAATISIINPTTLAVAQTVSLPRASQPFGIAFAPGGGSAFVVLEAGGQLLRLDPSTGAQQAAVNIGLNARHLSITADATNVLVSRFVTPPLPGESSATVDTSAAGGEVLVVSASTMAITRTITLRHSDKTDTEIQGSGVPNYLAAAVISPDGRSAWVPSKQDNVRRGTLRNGQPLDFQNTVRAISSRIDMATLAEDYARRIDHDNSSVGAGAAYHPSGVFLFVALETSRQVAVVDAIGGRELMKVDVGRAPQAVAVSVDGSRLYVQNFMDRSVSVLDLAPLVTLGELRVPLVATVGSIGTEKLAAQVLTGKQLFYDARDPRLARDSYMSCASCHNDGGHDGRVWDLTGFGEGLRNTIMLRGRAAMGHGFLHWSANFDELQDFEGQIRNLAGGTGLMTDAQFNTGTRNQPLGDVKAGASADLDALAAYVTSLNSFAPSPSRGANGALSTAAVAGRDVFQTANCASCHLGAAYTVSGNASQLKDVGTIVASSGKRLNAALTGIDVPTLRDVWATAPYLHDGRAATLVAAVQAHAGNRIGGTDLTNLSAYLQEIGSEEPAAAIAPVASAVNCASENQTCTLPAGATATVWYGASSSWAARTGVTGSIACDNATFGDPLVGTGKSCRYVITASNVAPTVSLTAPVANASFVQGTSITLSATASDSDGTVSKVEFYDGATLIGTDTTAPYSLSWTNAATGSHSLTARAYDNADASTTGAAVSIVVNVPVNVPPSVSLTAPSSNASFAQGTAIALSATATDNDGTVSRVDFYDGATLIGTDTTSPYSLSWTNAAIGSHSLTARAYDDANASSTSGATAITVTSAGTGNGTLTLRARASLAGGVGANVDLRINGSVVGTVVVGSTVFQDYPFTVPTIGAGDRIDVLFTNDAATPEDRNLYVESVKVGTTTLLPSDAGVTVDRGAGDAAFDGVDVIAGQGGLYWNAALRLTMPGTAPVDNTAPSVSISSPSAGASVTGTVTVTATASDNVGVAGVQFLLDGVALGAEDTSSPYSVSWNTSTATAGAHTLTARARDVAGNQATSGGVGVTVTAGSGSTLTLRARASLAGGVGANVDLRINGSVVGTVVVGSTVFQDYPFTVPTIGAGDRIDVVFTNDAATPEDRNLYVESVKVGTTTLLPTDAGVTVDRGAGDAAFDGVDVIAGQGGLYWNAALRLTMPGTAPTDNTAPSVSISSPSAGASVTGTVTVTATASDNVGVAGVQFLLDGVALGAEATSSPYSVSWNTTTATAGAHTLTARARDAAGNQATSGAVGVTVGASGTTTITVRARANLSGGIGANMELRVNGTIVGATLVDTTTFVDFPFANVAVAAGDRIDVVFTNDASTPEDRNLYVESVKVGTTTILPTAAGVTIDRGGGTAAFDGVDVIAGQSGIYWNAALRMTAP